MALLTKQTRIKWFKLLGYEYNKEGILKLQRKYFKRAQDRDGIYGKDTDALLRHLHHVKVYASNFKPDEFACHCGHCTGYPTWMRVNELKHIQTIRNHYGKPMIITSGLRCKYENDRLAGSSKDSAHMIGKAVDFYMEGRTNTLNNRRETINYIKRLKYHDYSYGDGISSTGAHVYAPNMGNAIHTQAK